MYCKGRNPFKHLLNAGVFILSKKVMVVKDEKKSNDSPKKKKRRNKEKLTIREIEDLMNMNVPTYYRKNGAVRRK
jgi:hypothetical protein